MTTIYTIDRQGVYSGAMDVDPKRPIPRSTLTAPPQTMGAQVAQWTGSAWFVLPEYPTPPAPPTPIPQAVTMRQARLALLGAGLLSSIDTAIAALPSPQKEAAQIEWEYSGEVQRHNGFVSALAPSLGLTDEQIDALFVTAAGIA